VQSGTGGTGEWGSVGGCVWDREARINIRRGTAGQRRGMGNGKRKEKNRGKKGKRR
jgi:hypothetical protein